MDILEKLLEEKIFFGLTNLNDGFDAPSIKYFSEKEFEIVLQRCKQHGVGIMGIEPWLDRCFYDVFTNDDFDASPYDPKWYFKAFEEFKSEGEEDLMYAASYMLPGAGYPELN